MPKKSSYRVLNSKLIYQGRVVRLVKDKLIVHANPGKVITRDLAMHPGAVAILPFVDSAHIVLLRQFRYAAKGTLWEIPAGTLEDGEQPLRCAKRELEEETGFRAKRWKYVTRFLPAPGISDEVMTLYRASGLLKGRQALDDDEFLTHRVVPFKKALRMIWEGKIRDGKTMIALLWTATHR